MKRRALLAVLCLCLIAGAAIRPAYAFFTTYTQTRGGYRVHLGTQTEIEEKFSQGVKSVTILNKEGQPVFVRVRAFGPSAYPLTYPTAEGWTFGENDGWWYYDAPVAAGEQTKVLDVKINNIPSDAQDGESFHVIVVYESTPVLYDEAGNPYADWSNILDNVTEGGGN